MKIQPLRDNVLIRADKDSAKTASGFVLAREWEKLPQTGEVLEVGPDVKQVAKGDYVRFHRYAFHKVDEQDFLGLESNIQAKLL